jgi:hypothetical protein
VPQPTRRAQQSSRRAPAARRGAVALPSRALLIAGGVVLLLVILLVVKGCGDKGLSASELRAQASEICVRANDRTDRVAVPNAPAGGARFLAEGLAIMRPALTRLQALRPKQELQDDYALAVAANARQLQLVEQAIAAIRRGGDPIDVYAQLQRRLDLVTAPANRAWRRLGISACLSR